MSNKKRLVVRNQELRHNGLCVSGEVFGEESLWLGQCLARILGT